MRDMGNLLQYGGLLSAISVTQATGAQHCLYEQGPGTRLNESSVIRKNWF